MEREAAKFVRHSDRETEGEEDGCATGLTTCGTNGARKTSGSDPERERFLVRFESRDGMLRARGRLRPGLGPSQARGSHGTTSESARYAPPGDGPLPRADRADRRRPAGYFARDRGGHEGGGAHLRGRPARERGRAEARAALRDGPD